MLLHPARLAAGLAVLHRVHATTAAVGSLLTKKGDLGKRFCRRAAGGSVLCRSCAVEIFCRSSSVYRLYHVLSCINDRTQYSWAMAAHHTSDDQPKGDAYGTGGGPVHRRPHAGSRVAIAITVIL